MHYDVIISGAGMTGAALACLLGREGQRVAVLEKALPAPILAGDDFDLRVSAINKFSRQILEDSGVWHEIVNARCQSYEKMVVWDSEGAGEIDFDAADLGAPELGHIVENRVIQQALIDAIGNLKQIDLYCPSGIAKINTTDNEITVSLEGGQVLRAGLLVGADGSRSRVRELAGIGWDSEDYGQKGLVAVVRTDFPHQETAWQRFMPGGPLAFLPLADPYHCSIVWSLPADRADAMLNKAADDFNQELERAFQQRLGAVQVIGDRAAFPLYGATASHYIGERIALIGDAAHVIHPLAGQGVNLGFKDAEALAKCILESTGDLGSLKVLRRYERSRRGDNHLTRKSMEGFRLLFGNTSKPLVWLRNTGLNSINNIPLVKHKLMRQAMGI